MYTEMMFWMPFVLYCWVRFIWNLRWIETPRLSPKYTPKAHASNKLGRKVHGTTGNRATMSRKDETRKEDSVYVGFWCHIASTACILASISCVYLLEKSLAYAKQSLGWIETKIWHEKTAQNSCGFFSLPLCMQSPPSCLPHKLFRGHSHRKVRKGERRKIDREWIAQEEREDRKVQEKRR